MTVQTCFLHLVRNSLRYASKSTGRRVISQLRNVHTAPTAPAMSTRRIPAYDM
ncbi:transposase [Agromyces sp. C10]|uniref:transposase n=1 Tax=Agromyces sp. C10 TaxID=2935077 RepID=UPI00200A3402|nr:transposase [Agromyces sp. C10]MCK8610099.1 transposase [Agromyces sp. C10]